MFRALFYALVSIFAITFIRLVVGVIMKGFGELLNSEGKASQSSPRPPRQGTVPTSGELKPCAKCGTYVLTSTERKLSRGGEVVYFCSDTCQRAMAATTTA